MTPYVHVGGGDEGEARERKKATYPQRNALPWTCWTTNSTRRCLLEQLQCPMYTLQRFHPHHPAPPSRLFHGVESKFGRGRPEDGNLWGQGYCGWGWDGRGRLDAGGDAGVVLGFRFADVVDIVQPLVRGRALAVSLQLVRNVTVTGIVTFLRPSVHSPASRSPRSLGVCLRTGVRSV